MRMSVRVDLTAAWCARVRTSCTLDFLSGWSINGDDQPRFW
jgi:hypothetical protein